MSFRITRTFLGRPKLEVSLGEGQWAAYEPTFTEAYEFHIVGTARFRQMQERADRADKADKHAAACRKSRKKLKPPILLDEISPLKLAAERIAVLHSLKEPS